ncbi:MAG: 3-dehydroquinate synthase [Clostridium sp.]|uniref:3-dehydroquinate synthase n=1 Tax=Clostridium sp. TaxID=1506 RepID=UPI0030340F6F
MKKIELNIPNNEYEIFIENGLINNIGFEISKIYNGERIAIITDKNVDKYYGNMLEKSLECEGYEVLKVVLEPGERSKSIECLMKLYDELLDFKINRGNLIIALGGGVIGDLTGFCASTLLRGIPFIQIPTSLLAQIDSSIGGKVAIDLPRGKNLIGSFYHPMAVYIDPLVLKTLDKRYINDGLGEVIKYGLIKDKNLYEKLKNMDNYSKLFESFEDIIYRCCNIKREIVEYDEMDTGERMILNFGHTIGHAIEKLYNFEKFSHGEAVAIGMFKIASKCEEKGICPNGTTRSIKEILIKYELPYEVDNIDSKRLIEIIGVDKKNVGNDINLILLKDIGEGFIKKVPREEVENFIY